MEPVHFGSDAWKDHPYYDTRFEDDDAYNEDFQRRYRVGRHAPSPKKAIKKKARRPRIFADYDGDGDDYRPF